MRYRKIVGKSKPLEPAGQIKQLTLKCQNEKSATHQAFTHDRGSLLVSLANFIHVIWDLREKKRDVGHRTGWFRKCCFKEAW